jgi:hypothetical protein
MNNRNENESFSSGYRTINYSAMVLLDISIDISLIPRMSSNQQPKKGIALVTSTEFSGLVHEAVFVRD